MNPNDRAASAKPDQHQKQFEKMTQTPVPRLVATLAVPTVASMLVTSIYNMADTYFVGQLGTSATAAVGIVFSLQACIQAVGFTLGMGANAISARYLGEKRNRDADVVASSAFMGALFFGLLLAVFGSLFIDGLMNLLGATPTILPYARNYGQYILLGAPLMAASFVMNNVLRSQGRAVKAMIGVGFGSILNIALDPLLIFVFDMGIAGAAVATIFSQAVSFCILLYFFVSGQSIVRIRPKLAFTGLKVYATVIKTGMPSLCRQGLASLASILLNQAAAVYGDPAVAAMSIVARIMMFIVSVLIGIGQGFQPVAGYNYGAKRYDRVKKAYWFTFQAGMILLGVLGVIFFAAAPGVIALFRKEDLEVISIGSAALRAQCIGLLFQPLTVCTNMAMQTTGRSWQATFLSAGRQGIFFVPLILILPRVTGLFGVQIAQACADLLTLIVTVPLLIRFFKEIAALEKEQKAQTEPAA